MPELFPPASSTPSDETLTTEPYRQGRSWRFDFDRGEFVMSPTRKIVETTELDSYVEWCYKALMTARYRYLVYGRSYGQEFEDLIRRNLSRPANESELKRLITECLMLNPLTASVGDFSFEWENDEVYVEFSVKTILGEITNLETRIPWGLS